MSRGRWLLCALAALSVCAALSPAPSAIERVETGLRAPVLIEGDQTWTLEEGMRRRGVHGIAIAVIKDFRIDWAKGYGLADVEAVRPVTEETLFQAASISKPVAAMVALNLAEHGKISLDAPINSVLVSWKLPENDLTRKTPVTMTALLSHTAGVTVHGFDGYAEGVKVPALTQVLEGVPPANSPPILVDLAPGTEYRYSGGGYTIAQQAMIDASGLPFPRLAAKTVLRPLGMNSSTYEQPLDARRLALAAAGYRADGTPVPGKRHVYPEMAAAGLWTTPSDLARFAIGLQEILRGRPGPISTAMAERMISPVLGNYGLGLGLIGQGESRYFRHDGANEGFQCLLMAHRTKGYGAAIMTNADDGILLIREVLRSIGAAYGWDGFAQGAVRLAKLSPEDLAGRAGRYLVDPDTVIVISAKGDALDARVTLGRSFELLPTSADTFVRRDADTQYIFDGQALRVQPAGEQPKAARRLPEGTRIPAEDLDAGRVDEALLAYRKLREADPSDPSVSEERFNTLGYQLLQMKQPAKALAVFELNTKLYPDSANTYDSLAEACASSGDKTRAVEFYRRALEVVEHDPKMTPKQKEAERANALARLKELGAS